MSCYFYKNKCAQYWPDKDSAFEVGPCKMQLLMETTYAFYTLRKFTVHNTKVRSRSQLVCNLISKNGTICQRLSFPIFYNTFNLINSILPVPKLMYKILFFMKQTGIGFCFNDII